VRRVFLGDGDGLYWPLGAPGADGAPPPRMGLALDRFGPQGPGTGPSLRHDLSRSNAGPVHRRRVTSPDSGVGPLLRGQRGPPGRTTGLPSDVSTVRQYWWEFPMDTPPRDGARTTSADESASRVNNPSAPRRAGEREADGAELSRRSAGRGGRTHAGRAGSRRGGSPASRPRRSGTPNARSARAGSAQALLAGGPDDQVGIRLATCVEMLGDVLDVEHLGQLLDRRAARRLLVQQ